VKANQPTLHTDLKDAFESLEAIFLQAKGAVPPWLKREWEEEGVTFTRAHDVSKGHGRREVRECWALSDPQMNGYAGSGGAVGVPWPHLSQIARVRRERILRGVTTMETVYLVTNLRPQAADASQLLAYNRAYWSIENRLHWVRDVTLGEDHSQVRTGAAPHMMAALRNLLLTLVHRSRATNVAAALRTFAARPKAAVALVLTAHLLQ
jgi:hypothetical protein